MPYESTHHAHKITNHVRVVIDSGHSQPKSYDQGQVTVKATLTYNSIATLNKGVSRRLSFARMDGRVVRRWSLARHDGARQGCGEAVLEGYLDLVARS